MRGSLEHANILIIGGGVIGLSIARALARRGRSVTVIEKHQFGKEASWAAGGILAPQVEADKEDDFYRLACASRDLYRDFARELQKESDVDLGFDTTGTIYVAFNETEAAEFQKRLQWQRARGLSIEWLTANEARKLEPNLSDKVRCALRFPNDYQVENRRLIEALVIANERLGVQLVHDCKAESFLINDNRAVGVESSRGTIPARWVVLAAGAWSSSIECSSTLTKIEVERVREQMLSYQPPPQFAHHVIYSSRGYLIPRRDGTLLAGSTTEEAGFDKRVTNQGVDSIKSMAGEITPAIKSWPVVDSWAGFRPRAKDGLPVLGPTKHVEGLFFATGHYRNGILLTPITAELIAEAIVSSRVPPMFEPFSPDRFRLTS